MVKIVAVFVVLAGVAGPQVPVFRTTRLVVTVHTSVKQGNQPVTGLSPADFRLHDSGVEQRVMEVAFEEVPIDVTLFVDNSGSTFGSHAQFNRDVRGIAALLRPVDRLRVIAFGLDVRVILDWTVPGAPIDVPAIALARLSSVYDGLYLSMLHRPDPDRRHLIVAMTDGVDYGGVIRSRTVEDLAGRTDGVVHLLRVSGAGGRGRPRGAVGAGGTFPDPDGPSRLDNAAKLTGGVSHSPMFGFNAVAFFKKAFDDFRTSYILRYSPSGVPAGGWHPLKVEVLRRGRLAIRHRQGYFGGQDHGPQDPPSPKATARQAPGPGTQDPPPPRLRRGKLRTQDHE